MNNTLMTLLASAVTALTPAISSAREVETTIPADSISVDETVVEVVETGCDPESLEQRSMIIAERPGSKVPNIYFMPYSRTASYKDWKRLWINTGTLVGAYVGALAVLECLPEDATSWNRAEIRNVPLFKRWYNHVIKEGPEWDHDKYLFNYVLHPYAGAAYFMSARSCGFNFWQSLLYSSLISTVGWEFGIEAFMERPSIQDIFITPLVGSVIGECFYNVKRYIVQHGYTLWGSPVLGNIVAFICDPLNEVIGLIAGNPCRKDIKYLKQHGFNLSSCPWKMRDSWGLGTAYGIQVNLVF